MSEDPAGVRPEIVIIRRRGGEEAGHHGGAWKIAYADFVTALMAFFLVMWLVNAANEATRAQVASYFNPIKLTDSSTGDKGLSDPKDAKKKQQQAGGASDEVPTPAEKAAEEQLLADPVKTLDKIAGPDIPRQAEPGNPAAGQPQTTSDPFDPMSWQSLRDASAKSPSAEASKSNPEAAKPAEAKLGKANPEISAVAADTPIVGKTAEVKPVKPEAPKTATAATTRPDLADQHGIAAKQFTAAATAARISPGSKPEPLKPADGADAAGPANASDTGKLALSQTIKNEILKELHIDPTQLPANIDVVPTDEGLLISLTDKTEFGMFTVGSAAPDPQLVSLIATIAGVLGNHPGFIVVRGHTDSRPFHNKKYDNWQLSSARAQMAYYMLVRGGLDEARVRRIEGYADRDPKLRDQPDAAVNRRIDILLGQDP